MLVLLSLTRNRWSVLHTSNVCCGYGLPTFAYPRRVAQLRRFQTFPPWPKIGRIDPKRSSESASGRLVLLSIIVTVPPQSLALRLS